MHGVPLGFGGADDLFGQPSRLVNSNFCIHLSVRPLELSNISVEVWLYHHKTCPCD